MKNGKCLMENMPDFLHQEHALPLWSNVSIPRPHLRFLRRALHFHADGSEFSVAGFVRRIVTQTVLRADLGGHAREGGPPVPQTRPQEIPAAAAFGERVHSAAREIVKVAANLHAFELAHLAEVDVILRPRARKTHLPA